MVKYALITFAGLAAALPLNINLGAYSPALVVGDGEISFGGAANGGAGAGKAGAGNAAAANAAAANNAQNNVAAPTASTVASPLPSTVESAATDPALSEQARQIANLQGLGKAIAPRIDTAETDKLGKRDLAGFDRALTFAEASLTKSPKVQLGTGEKGSGIGILVEHNPNAGAGAGAGARPAAAKRGIDETTTPKRRTKVTTMFVRRGIPASLQSARSEDTIAAAAAAEAAAAIAARAPAPAQEGAAASPSVPIAESKRDISAFDAVNLNVNGDAGVTMTFVETVDDDEDDE